MPANGLRAKIARGAAAAVAWRRWGAPAATLLLAVLAAPGCSPTHGQLVEFLRSHEVAVSTGHYTVQAPDAITIHAPAAAEIDGVTQTIRADGKIVLRLLGEVFVAGMTTEQIAAKLRAQLSRYYVEPEVVVEVTGYRSQFYYVFGEVGRPGVKPYTGRDTLLRALADAGPTFLAWRARIRVVRPSPGDDPPKIITVNLDKMVRDGHTAHNILLQEGDIVEVPPTPLAWIGHRVRELLYPIDPAVRAYTAPATAMDATDTYENRSGDNRGRLP